MTILHIPPRDDAKLFRRKLAVFQPSRTDNLRPELLPMIGKTFTFRCADYGSIDEPFPGQYRWFAVADGSDAMRPDFPWWVPDEDLIDVHAAIAASTPK